MYFVKMTNLILVIATIVLVLFVVKEGVTLWKEIHEDKKW